MKGFCVILFLIIHSRLLSQDFELMSKGDTLTIKATNITNDLFQFGNNPLSTLQKFNPIKSFKTYKNIHAADRIDTIFTLIINKDTFEIIKWHKEQNFLLGTSVKTNRFRTKHGLQVGMQKNEVIQQLSQYKLKSVPGHLILEEVEIYQLVILEFAENRLNKIIFLGYSD